MAWYVPSLELQVAVPLYLAGLFVACMFCHGELARLKPDPRAPHALLPDDLARRRARRGAGGDRRAARAAGLFRARHRARGARGRCSRSALRRPRGSGRGVRGGCARRLVLVVRGAQRLHRRRARHGARLLRRGAHRRPSEPGAVPLDVPRRASCTAASCSAIRSATRRPTTSAPARATAACSRSLREMQPEEAAQRRRHRPGRRRDRRLDEAGRLRSCSTRSARGWSTSRGANSRSSPTPRRTPRSCIGDGRLSLEREPPRGYDVLGIDAFSGDSIPMHLVTREAMAIYVKHLKPDGVIVFQATNRFIDLLPVVKRLAAEFGLRGGQRRRPARRRRGRRVLVLGDRPGHRHAQRASCSPGRASPRRRDADRGPAGPADLHRRAPQPAADPEVQVQCGLQAGRRLHRPSRSSAIRSPWCIGAEGLDSATMQRIAALDQPVRNHLPAESSEGDYRLRIFTPRARAAVRRPPDHRHARTRRWSRGFVSQEDQTGPGVRRGRDRASVEDDGRFFVKGPPSRRSSASTHDAVGRRSSLPVQSCRVDVGPVWVVGEMSDARALAALKPDMTALAEWSEVARRRRRHGVRRVRRMQRARSTYARSRRRTPFRKIRSAAAATSASPPTCATTSASAETTSRGRARSSDVTGAVFVRMRADGVRIGGHAVTCVDGSSSPSVDAASSVPPAGARSGSPQCLRISRAHAVAQLHAPRSSRCPRARSARRWSPRSASGAGTRCRRAAPSARRAAPPAPPGCRPAPRPGRRRCGTA